MAKKQGTIVRRSAALAVASLACVAPVHAQSSVTLYGIVDGSILYTNRTLTLAHLATGRNDGRQLSFTDSGLSPSRFGLTGKEDLGGGFQTLFKLESGISIANGGFADSNGNLFGRQAWVGLDSPYGTVTMGLQYSPFFLAVTALDPRHMSQFGSSLVTYVDNVLGTGAFSANAINYTSPRIAGLRARAMLGLGNVAGSFSSGRTWSASLDYQIGGLLIDAALYDSNSGAASTPIPSTRQFEGRVIGASYNFGPVTAKASFANYKVAGIANNNVYEGGFEYYVTPALVLNGSVQYTSDRNHTVNHSILSAVGAEYALSRRTSLYTQVGLVDNHGTMNTGLSIQNALYAPGGRTVGVDVGIHHSF